MKKCHADFPWIVTLLVYIYFIYIYLYILYYYIILYCEGFSVDCHAFYPRTVTFFYQNLIVFIKKRLFFDDFTSIYTSTYLCCV